MLDNKDNNEDKIFSVSEEQLMNIMKDMVKETNEIDSDPTFSMITMLMLIKFINKIKELNNKEVN